MGFSEQEYWSGLSFSSGDLLNPGIKPSTPTLAGGFFATELPGKPPKWLSNGLKEAQAGIKISGTNINNLRYADDTILMAESEEELKSLLIKVESEKLGLKLNIQKMKIMASGPIILWEIDGERVETVPDFIFWALKSMQMVISAMKLKDAYSLEGKLWPT